MFPGGELAGDVVSEPVVDWSFASPGVLDLETRPEDPYSVSINFIVREGALYIDPAEGRRWLEHIRADPRVRIRLAGQIHPRGLPPDPHAAGRGGGREAGLSSRRLGGKGE